MVAVSIGAIGASGAAGAVGSVQSQTAEGGGDEPSIAIDCAE